MHESFSLSLFLLFSFFFLQTNVAYQALCWVLCTQAETRSLPSAPSTYLGGMQTLFKQLPK
jgi:hypothetical protein